VAEKGEDYSTMSPEQLLKRAEKLENKMLKHARDLEFEAAARLRDEIQQIRALAMGTGLAPA
jgi:excinuclease ABC subunit B